MSVRKWIGIGFVVLVVGFLTYIKLPISKKKYVEPASIIPVMETETNKIKIQKPDTEIELKGTTKNEASIVRGVIAKSECIFVAQSPEKVIRAINCINGIIELNDLSCIETDMVIYKNNEGDRYYLCDSNGKEVWFRYCASVGDLNGRQSGKTVKLFAMAKNYNGYVIMECPNAIASIALNGRRTIQLNPVVEGLRSEEMARQVLAELFYLDSANINMLLPPPTLAARK